MNRFKTLAISTMAMLCVGIALTAAGAMAQGMSKIDKTKLVGTWTVVSVTNTSADGKVTQVFGPNDGLLVFERNGKFVQVEARSAIPNFASNNRNTGSPDENKAVVQGSLAYFGTYTVGADGTLIQRVERSSYSNLNGTDRKITITSLTADELKWRIVPTIGGIAEATWKRVK